MSGVSFAGTWEIGTPSTAVREFGHVTSLAGVGDLGVRASIIDVGDLRISASLEDVWKIWTEKRLADACRIGIEASLGDHIVGTSIADALRIGAATSLVGVRGLRTGDILVSEPRRPSQAPGVGSRHMPSICTSLVPKDLLRSSLRVGFPIVQQRS